MPILAWEVHRSCCVVPSPIELASYMPRYHGVLWHIVRARPQLRCYSVHVGKRMTTAAGAYFSELPVEPLERYRPGGYHPTHIGDDLNNKRYTISHKLGWGSYSTVWLAQDRIRARLVCLKILAAELGVQPREVQILELLRNGEKAGDTSSHVSRLLDRFTHQGPNGAHSCLVFDVDSVSVSSVAERYPLGRLPGWLAWEIARQIAQGVGYLHSKSVVHGGRSKSHAFSRVKSLTICQTSTRGMSC